MGKFAVAVRFNVIDGKQNEAAALFSQISKMAREADGCEAYVVHFMGKPGQFFCYQLFRDEEAFHAFRAPEECNRLRKQVDALCTSRKRMHIVGQPL